MTTLIANPQNLTKAALKSELEKHNISLPASDARKDVYVRIYRTLVLNQRSEFSSDDEEISKTPTRKRKPGAPKKNTSPKKAAKSQQIEQNNIMATLDVYSMSDDQLASQLRLHGVNVGPIVDSTRRVYQKKLDRLLSEKVHAEPVKSVQTETEEEDYSDNEETSVKEVVETEHVESKVESVRRRITRNATDSSPARSSPRRAREEEVEESEVILKREVHELPQVRASISSRAHPVHLAQKTTPLAQTTWATPVTAPAKPATTTTTQDKPVAPAKRGLSLWVQVAVFLIVAIIIFLIIQNMEPAGKNSIGEIDS